MMEEERDVTNDYKHFCVLDLKRLIEEEFWLLEGYLFEVLCNWFSMEVSFHSQKKCNKNLQPLTHPPVVPLKGEAFDAEKGETLKS